MERITFIFDTASKKPACVLIQALYGGDRRACWYFRDWEVVPTKTMVKVRATEAEIKALAELCNQA